MMLSVRDLKTRFVTRQGIVHAANGVDFDVAESEVVGIVGESGSGKTVTINSVLGLIRPPGQVTDGTAVFEGTDLLSLSRRQRRRILGNRIGFIAQNPFGALNPILPVRDQFVNVTRAHGSASTSAIRKKALEMLRHVGIAGPERVLDGYAHELSGGMAQRVVIAIALLLDPRLVVADEPTTALDVTVQRQILDLITSLVRESNRSLLIVTHDLGVVTHYCDRVVVMYAGRVVEQGPVEQVFTRPLHPYTLALLRGGTAKRSHCRRAWRQRARSPHATGGMRVQYPLPVHESRLQGHAPADSRRIAKSSNRVPLGCRERGAGS